MNLWNELEKFESKRKNNIMINEMTKLGKDMNSVSMFISHNSLSLSQKKIFADYVDKKTEYLYSISPTKDRDLCRVFGFWSGVAQMYQFKEYKEVIDEIVDYYDWKELDHWKAIGLLITTSLRIATNKL